MLVVGTDSPMKVLVATHSYTGNGAAVMLLAVLEHWVKTLGWTVDVLLDVDAEVPEELARTGVSAFATPNPEDYDFGLVNTLVSGRYLDMLAPKLRTVLWVHEGETVVWSSSATPAQWRNLFGVPWKIIFQSPWQPESVFKSFLINQPPGKTACVRNGLPTMPANLLPRPKSNGKKRIVFIGGVYGRKRPNDLVDAVLALGRNDVECIFVGSTANLDTIGLEHAEKLKARPDLFVLAGELDRRSGLEYLAGADVFCLPSGDESQPIAPLEAATLGVPCLLTDLPPYAGIWSHGRNCLLHPVGDVALLRWNIAAALDDSAIRARIASGARELLDRFSIASFVQRFTAEMPI